MGFIATLIAKDRLDDGDIRAVVRGFDAAGVGVHGRAWLERGKACDLELSRAPDVRVEQPGIDIVVQAAANRRKRLLIADMDSTVITVECIDELADYAGVKGQVAAITEQAMRGTLDFEAALTARVALLAGLDEAVLDQCLRERVRSTSGARVLVGTMKRLGAATILVSGGFTHFSAPVGAALGFDRVVANRLETNGGKLTGRVILPIIGADTKRQVLLDACAELGITRAETLAVGDGANDIPMLTAAGLGIAFHAKPAARAAADAAIDSGDLTAILYALGIARSEWVLS